MKPPVHLPGHGALLEDGTFIPQADIDRAVRLIEAAVAVLADWQARVVAEAEGVTEG